jgi:hypothetical protein
MPRNLTTQKKSIQKTRKNSTKAKKARKSKKSRSRNKKKLQKKIKKHQIQILNDPKSRNSFQNPVHFC